MNTFPIKTDERVQKVHFTKDTLIVDLMDGRTISVPLTWYPKLLHATSKQRLNWEICGGGYGIHWPEIDEDLHTAGLLRGAPAPIEELLPKRRRFSSGKEAELRVCPNRELGKSCPKEPGLRFEQPVQSKIKRPLTKSRIKHRKIAIRRVTSYKKKKT